MILPFLLTRMVDGNQRLTNGIKRFRTGVLFVVTSLTGQSQIRHLVVSTFNAWDDMFHGEWIR